MASAFLEGFSPTLRIRQPIVLCPQVEKTRLQCVGLRACDAVRDRQFPIESPLPELPVYAERFFAPGQER